MSNKDFEETLIYCLYICNDEDIKLDLHKLQIKFLAEITQKKDFKRLKQLEKDIQKQFR
jgi:FAD synthase